MRRSSLLRSKKEDLSGVSPVIGVILMVAITIVLAGVVFVWASEFTDYSKEEVDLIQVKLDLKTTLTNHPSQELLVYIISGHITWEEIGTRVDGISLNGSNEKQSAGDEKIFDVPNHDFPSGGLKLEVGVEYLVKIISLDNNKIIFNGMVICGFSL